MASLRAKYEPVARAAARANGIDDDLFVRQISQESGWADDVIDCRRASSAGAQGIAQIVARFHPGVNPCDPVAALEYAAGLMRAHLATRNGDWALALASYNAGPGAVSSGLSGNLAGWPYAETVRYVVNILGISEANARRRLTGGAAPMPTPIPYNPDAPVAKQPDDWSCSLESVAFLLRSIGRNPSRAWLEGSLVPGIISRQVGLQDATGKGMADWLNREYGAEMGFTAHAVPVAFDDVKAGAGTNPTMIGGRNYGPGGHWVGVRRVAPDGSLDLANPASNYTNTGPTLDRAEWDARGPWSAIYIDRMSTAPTTPPIDPKKERVHVLATEIRDRLAELESVATGG